MINTLSINLVFSNLILFYIFALNKTSRFKVIQMLGEKLKELRKLNELLQRKIAVELDVDTDYISKMDSNKKPVSRHYLQKLSVLLGIAEDEILTLWMADKLYDAAKDGAVTIKAMEVAHDELINLSKRKKK